MKRATRRHSEHLVKTGIDLIINEFINHAYVEANIHECDDTLEEEINTAAKELKKIIEAAYIDMYGRLNNGEFRKDLREGDEFWTKLLRSKK